MVICRCSMKSSERCSGRCVRQICPDPCVPNSGKAALGLSGAGGG
jgi:hypothetical protein